MINVQNSKENERKKEREIEKLFFSTFHNFSLQNWQDRG